MSEREVSYGIYGDLEGDIPVTGKSIDFLGEHPTDAGRDNYGGDLFGDPGAFLDQNDKPHRKVTEAQRLGFHRDAVLPEVPEGMRLAKVSGEPVVIPLAGDDPKVGKSVFTEKQLHAIGDIVEEKRKTKIASRGEIFRSDIYFG